VWAEDFRITHPFHPLSGQQFALVTYRHSFGDHRVCFHDADGRLRSIPVAWTSLVAPDPAVLLAAGRAPFRVGDLLAVARLLPALTAAAPAAGVPSSAPARAFPRASDKEITP
jgi:hypothetical protein